MHRMLVILFWATWALFAPGCASTASHSAWEIDRGGIACTSGDARLSPGRAHAALARVAPGDTRLALHVSILNNAAPLAHSFRDGALYLSTGLLQRLTDEELSAVLAHELGHLIIDGFLTPEPAALSGSTPPTPSDVELHADFVARSILDAHHLPAAALTTALAKVAAASRGEPFYRSLMQRVATLRSLDVP
jgi:hypothetical protein